MNWTLVALIGFPLLLLFVTWLLWFVADDWLDVVYGAILIVCALVVVGILAWGYFSLVLNAVGRL